MPSTATATGDPDASATSFDGGTVTLMSAGHFVHDTYPAFVGVLLPLLIPKLGLSLAQAGLLASGIRWTTMLQPLMGYFADRTDTRYWVIVAPATTALFISLIGLAPSFLAVFVLLLLTGVSHAAFHPAAAAVVTRASGTRWGKGTSYFMTGGELGRALGPLYIAAVLTWVNLEWSWIAVVPGLVFSFLFYGRVRRSRGFGQRRTPGHLSTAIRRSQRPLLLLCTVIALRSVANATMLTFLPTWLVSQGADLVFAGIAMAAYELGGTAGAFVGGTVSDRLGRRSVIGLGLAVGLPVLAVAVLETPGPLQLAILAVAGFAVLSAMPVQIAFMHELLPENRSVATGITYFMTTGGAIVAAIGIGVIADLIGLQLALLLSIAIGLLAMPAILLLPRFTAPTSSGSQPA